MKPLSRHHRLSPIIHCSLILSVSVLSSCLFLRLPQKKEWTASVCMNTSDPQVRNKATAILSQRLFDCSGKEPQLSWHADTLYIQTQCDSAMIRPLLTVPGNFMVTESYSMEEISHLALSVMEEAEKLQTSGTVLYDASGKPVDYPVLSFRKKEETYPASPEILVSLPQDTAKTAALFRLPQIVRLLPDDLQFCWYQATYLTATYFEYIAVRSIRQPVTNSMIQETALEYNPSGMADIRILLKQEYHKTWERMTRTNIGRALPLMIDGTVHSYPTVQSEIIGGRFTLSNRIWSVQETEMFAAIVAHDPLPCTTMVAGIRKDFKPELP